MTLFTALKAKHLVLTASSIFIVVAATSHHFLGKDNFIEEIGEDLKDLKEGNPLGTSEFSKEEPTGEDRRDPTPLSTWPSKRNI